jgi:hypothetical protein
MRYVTDGLASPCCEGTIPASHVSPSSDHSAFSSAILFWTALVYSSISPVV